MKWPRKWARTCCVYSSCSKARKQWARARAGCSYLRLFIDAQECENFFPVRDMRKCMWGFRKCGAWGSRPSAPENSLPGKDRNATTAG